MYGFFVSRVVSVAFVEMWTPLLFERTFFESPLVSWYKTTSSTAAKLGRPCWKGFDSQNFHAQQKMRHVHGGVFVHQKIPCMTQSPTIKWQCRQKKVHIFYKHLKSVPSLPLERMKFSGRGGLVDIFWIKINPGSPSQLFFLNGFFHSIKEGCTMSNFRGLLF